MKPIDKIDLKLFNEKIIRFNNGLSYMIILTLNQLISSHNELIKIINKLNKE